MPEMDGLRALAVFSVLYQHWFHPVISVGSWGVILFFVISGFLITRSLLTLRENGMPLRDAAVQFFTRRALRLFPAYYLVLALGVALSPEVLDHWAFYAAYLSNVLLAVGGKFIPLTPTWSLAVEEQFYIFWFFAVICMPVRLLRGSLIVTVSIAIAFRVIFVTPGHVMAIYLLPSCGDALAIGALLCLAERAGWVIIRGAGFLASTCLAIAVALSLSESVSSSIAFALSPLLIACASGWAVWQSRTGFGGWVGTLLGSRPVAYLGQISYGIYLYHMVTNELFHKVPFLWRLGGTDWPRFCVHVVMTVALAALSYHVMEQPLLGLYRSKRVAEGSANFHTVA
jgi:peptidoglycan/LPS O-acetylase OafA/YrhL